MSASATRTYSTAAAAITGIQVGATIVATRYVVGQTGPTLLALLRYLIGLCCLVPPILLIRRVSFARGDWVPIALLGIVQFGVLVALLNFGLEFVTAARAALIFAAFPFLTMVLGAAFGREQLTLNKTIGVLLTITGVGAVLWQEITPDPDATTAWIGDLAVFLAASCGAVCSVLYKPYLKKYPTVQVSALAMLASVAFLGVLTGAQGVFRAPLRLTPQEWVVVFFIGISSGIGYYLWLWALARSTPTRVSAFLALSPITAALLGALLLAEPITFATTTGTVLVCFGLVVAHRHGASSAGDERLAPRDTVYGPAERPTRT